MYSVGKVYYDHLGNKYKTKKEMLLRYNISEKAFDYRLKNGWTLEKALTTPLSSAQVCYDHLGNKFNSRIEMCRHYGITKGMYCYREEHGWTLEEILTGKITCYDHLGNGFKTRREMCKFHNMDEKTFASRIHLGWSVKDALEMKEKKYYDHLGNEFNTVGELIRHYGLTEHIYYKRMSEGNMSLEEVLTTPDYKTTLECYDHLGNKFSSQKEMCEHYGLHYSTLTKRLKQGMSLKDALTCKDRHVCYDHLGNEFASRVEMGKYYGINYAALSKRLESGMSIKDALTVKVSNGTECQDHLGNKFNSVNDMCRHYNISSVTFRGRVTKGWSIKDALTKKVDTRERVQCCDHLGNKFNSREELCRHYNISVDTLLSRLRSGWTLKDALTTETKSKQDLYDSFGNKFKSKKELAEHYGVDRQTYFYRIGAGYSSEEALGIRGRGLDIAIKNKESINIHIKNIKFAYTGARTKKIYYTCIDKDTGEELLLNADEILMYKQSDYRTAVEQLIKRRKEKLSCQSNV